jgi:hypothetical protein
MAVCSQKKGGKNASRHVNIFFLTEPFFLFFPPDGGGGVDGGTKATLIRFVGHFSLKLTTSDDGWTHRLPISALQQQQQQQNVYIFSFGSEKRDQQKGGYDRWHGRLGK